MVVEFNLTGSIPSKKNSWRMGNGRIFQSKQTEINALLLELKSQMSGSRLPLVENDCRLNLTIYGDNRNDLDNQVTTICDLLQKAGIVGNDRQIKQIEAQKIIEKPHRAEIEVCEFELSS